MTLLLTDELAFCTRPSPELFVPTQKRSDQGLQRRILIKPSAVHFEIGTSSPKKKKNPMMQTLISKFQTQLPGKKGVTYEVGLRQADATPRTG